MYSFYKPWLNHTTMSNKGVQSNMSRICTNPKKDPNDFIFWGNIPPGQWGPTSNTYSVVTIWQIVFQLHKISFWIT